jgi:hypothetical protein
MPSELKRSDNAPFDGRLKRAAQSEGGLTQPPFGKKTPPLGTERPA